MEKNKAKAGFLSNCINIYAIGVSVLLLHVIYTHHPEWIGMNSLVTSSKVRESRDDYGERYTDVSAASTTNLMGITFINSNREAYSHPLDPFTETELSQATKLLFEKLKSDSQYNGKNIYIHSYWLYSPPKEDTFNYLEKKAKTSNMPPKFDVTKFPHIITLDVSFENAKMENSLRQYYNVLIDLTNNKFLEINKIDTNNFGGFPMITNMDFEMGSQTILSDSQVFDYFYNTLHISKNTIENNIVCLTTAPIVDYVKLMAEKGLVDARHRFSFPICFDTTFTAEYSYQNQVPFVGIVDLDLAKLVDFFDCNDLKVACKHYNQYNLKKFLWSDSVMTKDTFNDPNGEYHSLLTTNDLSTCQQQRFSNKFERANVRPKIEFDYSNKKPTFVISNKHEILWQGWSFHEGFSIRFGGVLSDIRFNNRSIVYNMHLSEIYVPYMANISSLWWYSKFYLDGSQYGVGWMMSTSGAFEDLNRLSYRDCPKDAHWFDTAVLLQNGEIATQRLKYACLFERYTGNPRQRHGEIIFPNGRPATIPQIELVYRYIISVGHYDYLVDKIFDLHGNIKISLAAHGYDQIKQVFDNDNGFSNKYCGYLSNKYCAPRHDHFFSFKVDFAVDSLKNTFYKGELVTEEQDVKKEWKNSIENRKMKGDFSKNKNDKSENANTYKASNDGLDHLKAHVWRYEERPMTKEKDCRLVKDPKNPKAWVFRSNVLNEFGTASGYEIYPVSQDINFMDAYNDIRDCVATWTQYGINVIKYKRDSDYASGKYTWQQGGRQGIERYIEDNENIENEDLVAFVTLGFHHITKVEDTPLLYEKRKTIVLEPNNFFEFSPSVCGDDV